VYCDRGGVIEIEGEYGVVNIGDIDINKYYGID